MKYNFFATFCLLLFFNVCVSAFSLKAILVNPVAGTSVKILCLENPFTNNQKAIFEAIIDSTGQFEFESNTNIEQESTLYIGKIAIPIYMAPQFNLQLVAQQNHLIETYYFKGPGCLENNYLADELKQDFDSKANVAHSILYTNVNLFTHYMDSIENSNRQFYKNNLMDQMVPNFKQKIKADINYKYVYYRNQYSTAYNSKTKKFEINTLPITYFLFLDTLNINDQQNIDNPIYQLALEQFNNYRSPLYDGAGNIKPNYTGVSSAKKVWLQYNFLKKTYKGRVFDFQATSFLVKNFRLLIRENLIDSILPNYYKYCKTDNYRQVISQINLSYQLLQPGKDILLNYKLINDSGKICNLEKYKNSTLILVFWSAANPLCKADFTKIELLKKQSKLIDVNFLYINLDESQDFWAQSILFNRPKGVNLFASESVRNKLKSDYQLNETPMYFSCTKQGKFAKTLLTHIDINNMKSLSKFFE
jgi:hypothetical protein